MTGLPLVLAHAGPGATWQALLVAFSLGLVVVFVLVLIGKVEVERPDDLVVPLGMIAVGTSLAPLGSAVLSDWVGWAFPIGCVMLVALVLTALTPLELGVRDAPTYGAVAIAAILGVALYQPITIAWHPPPEFLPLADDVTITVSDPADGGSVPAGEVTVTVTVDGGSLADELVPFEQVPADPEEAGTLAVALDGSLVDIDLGDGCPPSDPCTEVSFAVEVDPGEHTLSLEFRRGDGTSFTPLVTDRIAFTAS